MGWDVRCGAGVGCAVLGCAVLCCAVLCDAVLCCAALCCLRASLLLARFFLCSLALLTEPILVQLRRTVLSASLFCAVSLCSVLCLSVCSDQDGLRASCSGPVQACAGLCRLGQAGSSAWAGLFWEVRCGCQSGFKLGQPAPSRSAGSMIVSASLIRQGRPALCRPARQAGSQDCSGAVLAAGLFCAMLSVCLIIYRPAQPCTAPPRFPKADSQLCGWQRMAD